MTRAANLESLDTMVAFRAPLTLIRTLNRVATQRNVTKSQLIRQALESFCGTPDQRPR